MLLSAIGFIITIGILVTFHEWGHFYFARLFGVHVKRFCIGFGKPIKIWHSKKHVTTLGATEYAIAPWPVGGFVQMAERAPEGLEPNQLEAAMTGAEDIEEVIPQGLAFQDKPAWQRAIVVAAGPIANFVLAIVMFAMVYILGNPTYKAVLGSEHQGFVVSSVDGRPVEKINDLVLYLATAQDAVKLTGSYSDGTPESITLPLAVPKSANPYEKYDFTLWEADYAPYIGGVGENTAAAKIGLKAGDLIQQIGDTPISSWQQIRPAIQTIGDSTSSITFARDGIAETLTFSPKKIEKDGITRYQLGIGLDPEHILNAEELEQYQVLERLNPLAALQRGAADTWKYTALTFTFMRQMVIGQQSLKNLSGPLTIADTAGKTLSGGFRSFVLFLGIVSLSLGFLNLLPIPMLDGGHLVLIALEKVRGRALEGNALNWYYRVGLTFVLLITVVAFKNDISRLFFS